MGKRSVLLVIGFVGLTALLIFTVAAENPDYTQTYGNVTFFFNRNEEKIEVKGINKDGTEIYSGLSTIKDIKTAKEIRELLIIDFLKAQMDVESTIIESEKNKEATIPKQKVIKLGNSTRGEKKELTREDKVIAIFHQKALERFKDNRAVISVKGNFSTLPEGKEKQLRLSSETRLLGESWFDQSCSDPTAPRGKAKPDFKGDICADLAWDIYDLQLSLVHEVVASPRSKRDKRKKIRQIQKDIRIAMQKLENLGVQCCQVSKLPSVKEIRKRERELKNQMKSLEFAKEGTVVSKPFEYHLRLPKPVGYKWKSLGVVDVYDVRILEKDPKSLPTPELSGDSQALE